MKFISKLLYKIPNPKVLGVIYLRWLIAVVSAFASVICFFSIDSYAADKANANGTLTVVGVVLALVSIAFFVVASSENEANKYKR